MVGESLPQTWSWSTLGEVASPQGRAIVSGPFGSNIGTKFFVETGVPVIRGNNLTTDFRRFIDGGFVFVTKEKADELGNCEAVQDDLVFTAAGSLGQVGLIPRNSVYSRYIISNKQLRARVDKSKVEPLFAFYWFASKEMVAYIQQRNTGSSVPLINLSVLRSLPIPLPPLAEQSAIAHVLGTLDDKIALNQQMNETLESIARGLFRSWFVNFDPVHAKAEGRGTGLPKPLAELIPDSFEATELGDAPNGWRIRSLGDMCLRVSMGPFGSDIKTDNFVPIGVPVVRGGNLKDGFIDDRFVYLSEEKATELKNANAFPGDIVITHRGTLGQVGIIPRKCRFPRYVVSQSQMVLSVDPSQASPEFIFSFLCSQNGQHQLLSNTSQTGVPAIARPTSSVKAIRIVVPPTAILHYFDEVVGKLSERCNSGWAESRTLIALRDTLLPKLISGELRLSDAERTVGGHV